MKSGSYDKKDVNSSILSHFIFVGLIAIEGIGNIFKLIVPNAKTNREVLLSNSNTSNEKRSGINLEIFKEEQAKKDMIQGKDIEELREILKGVDIMSNISKSQLIELILSSPEAGNKLIIAEKKRVLNQKTAIELKGLLKGVKNVSKLKKSELVEMALNRVKEAEEINESLIANKTNPDKGCRE